MPELLLRADHDKTVLKKGQSMKKNNSRSYKNRILKTTLGITLAAVLVVQGVGTGMHMGLSQAAAAEQSDNTAKLKTVYLSGSGKKGGDGTSKDSAVSSFEKAKSLAADNGTILVCGTITISGETKLAMPSGITVKRADGFSGPIIKVEGSGKLILTYGWLSASDVDTKSANLGADAFVVGEKAKEESKDSQEQKKEENPSGDNSADKADKEETKEESKEETKEEPKEEQKEEPKEEPKEETPAKKQEAPAVTVPDTMTMKEPATLESMFMGDGFEGDGTFRFAEPEKIPDTYESTQQIIFTPNDTETYDYSGIPGWSQEGQQVIRSVKVYVESLKTPEPSAEDKEESKKDESVTEDPKQDTGSGDTGKSETAENPNGSDRNTDTDKKDTDETEKPADDKKDPDKTEKPTDDKKDVEDKKDDTSKKEEPKKEGSDKKDDTSKKEDTSEKEPVGSLWDKATDVKISGDFIPSYVEVRVSVNTDLDSMPKADIEQILQAYEIKLWDLKADKKYTIPDGKKVTVSIPVPKDADLYKKLLIGHYIEETGNYEYFTLGTNMNVVDGYLVFETGSLSPFNVGGSQLVGIGTQSPNHKPVVPSTGTTGNSGGSSVNKNNGNGSSSTVKKPVDTSVKKNNGTVIVNPRTGDETPILTYVLAAAAAVIVVVILVVLSKRKKK